ncbi:MULTISPECIES: flagellar basal body rod C-terminal domain-containing protein [Gammaproteobacteria]|uniref:flagellar basal body rod C-terminal domain-containing protein n=1 Tax=Gammaproteobacteria TaxID=1236 RepID=UPI000DD0DD98|nr:MULTISPECIES: flagellar basal body rod C-terminal domain-containing protein [Gammaproteobacteria]RTE86455.1 flagellar hook protein FlgE [Aliidiomarina sp. B3213]TCZ90990.1 flagellar hook protein FlgE [Lysobacter sp. N42]
MQINSSQNAVFTSALQGMQQSSDQVVDASQRIAKSGAMDAEAAVDLIAGEKSYTANAKVLATQSDMVGTLLNIKA